MTMIGLLYRGATGDGHGRFVVTKGDNAFVDEIVGTTHATDGVVNLRRAIDGDDDVIEEGSDFLCAFVQEETCGQESELNLPIAKEVAKSRKIVVQQRFAAREDNLSDAKSLYRVMVTFQIPRSHLFVGFALPDVAHDTAAVASTVSVEDEDR
jgi:hypothetical protein